ncbi:MAG: retropepsin-like aspartic protease [Pseudomonadota bacterium]
MRILAGLAVVIALFGTGFGVGQWWALERAATASEPVALKPDAAAAVADDASVISSAGRALPAFAAALEARDWDAMVRLVEHARLEGRDAEFAALYPALRAVAADLVAAEAPEEAAQLLATFTALNPADAEARFALADAWLAADAPAQALTPVLEILSAPLTQDIALQAAEYRDRLVALERERLALDGDTAGLIALYERLRAAEPTNEMHQVGLARAQLEAGELTAADATLRSIVGFEADTDTLDSLRDDIEARGSELRIDRQGNELYTAAAGAGRELKLLVDTGASQTALSSEALAALDARRTGEIRRVLTAAGEIEAAVFEVAELELAGRAFAPVEVLELTALPRDADGLLGLDLLKEVGDLSVLSATVE